MTDARFDATLRVAERAAEILATQHVPCVVIGALALAFDSYPRATEGLDLAIALAPASLEGIAAAFRAEGWDVELRMPDAADPLGGVIDIRAPDADLVQVVNFDNAPGGGFPRLVAEATRSARPVGDTTLRVVDLRTLVVFKLYAGGAKSALDIIALLERNDVDIAELRDACDALGLGAELERVLALRG